MATKISQLIEDAAPGSSAYVEVIIPPYSPGTNRKVLLSNLPGSSGGTSIPFGSTSGTNTYTIAATPAVTAYTEGMLLHVRVAASSTGLVTFNFDSVGAKKVLDTNGTQAQDGYLKAGVDYILAYNSALDSAAGAFTVVNELRHGGMNVRGVYAASGGLYPGSGGSGPSGAIRHGDGWVISGTDTVGSIVLRAGDFVFTTVDAPGQTASNWFVLPGYAAVDLKQALVNTAVAITDASSMDLTAIKHTLTTSSATRTFTISYTGDEMNLKVILNAAGSTFTFPAGALCISEGVAQGTNTCPLNGVSGDVYVIVIYHWGSSVYTVVCKNTGQ